jgi:predicted TPR repeat methyltransferase
MPKPKINPVILLEPVEDGFIAYDPARDRLHKLNPIAALLTELCDGSRSIAQIRRLAGPLMPDGKGAEIDRWIDEGIKAGLLAWQGHAAEEFSAKEQARHALRSALFCARRLGKTQKIEALYIDAQKAAARNPNDWEAWHSIGKISQYFGRREEARIAYQKYLQAHPEDGEIEQILVALQDAAPPPRAADRTIQHIYRNFAAGYDWRMREDLKYVGPERLGEAIDSVLGDKSGLSVLDLGCGSGLAGPSVRERADLLVGIDLSPEMIALARARNIYDRLEVAEITAWLGSDDSLFDLIICCDCLIYFGDLSEVLGSAARRLKQSGLMAISMERGEHPPFRLSETGRYTHHPDHIREAAAQSGLNVVLMREGFLRMEYAEEVTGVFAILCSRAQSSSPPKRKSKHRTRA